MGGTHPVQDKLTVYLKVDFQIWIKYSRFACFWCIGTGQKQHSTDFGFDQSKKKKNDDKYRKKIN